MSLNGSDTKVSHGVGAGNSVVPQAQTPFAHTIISEPQLELLNDSSSISVAFTGLHRTSLHIAFEGSQSRQLSVWRTRTESGFWTRPKIAADLVTIRFVQSGAMLRNGVRGRDVAVAFDQALFTSFEQMRYEQAFPGFAAITATVGSDAVIKACQSLGGTTSTVMPQFDSVADVNTAGLVALRNTIGLLLRTLSGSDSPADLMSPLLEELLIYQFISAWPTIGTPVGGCGGTSVSDRPVRAAIDFIEASLTRRVAIAEIAAAAGLSVRMLQIAFKRQLGCTPVQYLIARRLDCVHANLRHDERRTVRQVAMDWGFVHMSDFGRRYRERFGHPPGDEIAAERVWQSPH